MTTMTKSDADTEAHVNAELFFDPRVISSDIHALVKNGHVTISGVADTFATKWAAEHAAFRVHGVHSIHNAIIVDPKLLDLPSDSDLASSVRMAIEWDASIPASRIHVLVLDGNVALSGHVDWYYQRIAAEQAAGGIRGVRSVTSEIVIIPPIVSQAEISQDIERALVRSALLDARHITVTADGSKVRLSGKVRTRAERNEALDAAWRAKGVAQVVDDINIEA